MNIIELQKLYLDQSVHAKIIRLYQEKILFLLEISADISALLMLNAITVL